MKQNNLPLVWKVNTAQLLQEILNNPGTSILSIPLNIFGKLLAAVGERAAQLNDDELNGLMARLAIYEFKTKKGQTNFKLQGRLIKKGFVARNKRLKHKAILKRLIK